MIGWGKSGGIFNWVCALMYDHMPMQAQVAKAVPGRQFHSVRHLEVCRSLRCGRD